MPDTDFTPQRQRPDLTGMRFGRLVVLGLERTQGSSARPWRCLCDCGNSVLTTGGKLRKGDRKSCGCLLAEVMTERKTRAKQLSHARLTELLAYDEGSGDFRWRHDRKWDVLAGALAGAPEKNGYLAIKIDQRQYFAHRLAWFYVHGAWPVHGLDHINGDVLDNRIANLRDVPQRINNQNKHRAMGNSTSGVLGVSPEGKRFRARIFVDGREVLLGYFDDPAEGHQAYLAAKRRLHEGCTI